MRQEAGGKRGAIAACSIDRNDQVIISALDSNLVSMKLIYFQLTATSCPILCYVDEAARSSALRQEAGGKRGAIKACSTDRNDQVTISALDSNLVSMKLIYF